MLAKSASSSGFSSPTFVSGAWPIAWKFTLMVHEVEWNTATLDVAESSSSTAGTPIFSTERLASSTMMKA